MTQHVTQQQRDIKAAVRALVPKRKVMPASNEPALTLFRMNGIGNKILVLDLRQNKAGYALEASHARAIVQDLREPYDQLMVLTPAQNAEHACKMTIFNQDGSISKACGNGTRCVMRYLVESAKLKAPVSLLLESDAGILACVFHSNNQISVNMGQPVLEADAIPLEPNFAAQNSDTRVIAWPSDSILGTKDIAPPAPEFSAVNMGNPHAIFLVKDVASYDLATWGQKLETCALFPERVNISLAKIITRDTVELKVWERGAGLTLACGSAACACVVALARRGLLNRTATVNLPGGSLIIDWQRDDCVIMSGAASFESKITLPADFYTRFRA